MSIADQTGIYNRAARNWLADWSGRMQLPAFIESGAPPVPGDPERGAFDAKRAVLCAEGPLDLARYAAIDGSTYEADIKCACREQAMVRLHVELEVHAGRLARVPA